MEKMSDVLIYRDKYMSKLRAARDTPLIKVITGLRRSGKSVLLEMTMRELLSTGISKSDILYISFDEDNDELPNDHKEFTRYVESHVSPGNGKYLFFDEVQNVLQWEKTIVHLYKKGCDIYITGSNSEMLSSEIATRLSGRCVEIQVRPLVFSEYLLFRDKQKNVDVLFDDFIHKGGMPAVAKLMDTDSAAIVPELIEGAYNTVYVKDIASHNNIRNTAVIQNLMKFVMRNIGDRTSSRNASNYLVSNNQKISHVTVEEYLKFMESAYVISRSRRLSSKTKEYLRTSDKFYASDLGIRHAIVPFKENDYDGILENIVFNELLYRYKEVATYDVDGMEVDFVTEPNGSPSYYQVCMSIANKETRERELAPLRTLKDNFPKYVITFERFITDEIDGIKIVQIVDWLLSK